MAYGLERFNDKPPVEDGDRPSDFERGLEPGTK